MSYNHFEEFNILDDTNVEKYKASLVASGWELSDDEISNIIQSIYQISTILVKKYISDSNADLEK